MIISLAFNAALYKELKGDILTEAANVPKLKQIIALVSSAIYVVAATYFAGLASTNIAYGLAFKGIAIPVREPLNIGIVLAFYWLFLKYQRNLVNNPMPIGGLKAVFFGVGTTIILLSATWFGLWQIRALTNFTPSPIDQQAAIGVIFGFVFVFIHGLSEQWLLQKIGQQLFAQFYGKWVGILSAGAMFAILQALQGYATPIYIVNSVVFGVLMAIMAAKFGILAAAAAHGFWTWAEVIYLPAAFDFHLSAGLFSGQRQDSYSSLIFTLVAAALCLILGFAKNFNYKTKHDEIKH
ncbi:MAG: hypothetical protein FD163_1510 [Hyphomonadaceae bacterium]|nr:MAG: hypothetical protein FD128_282 [Hyphomonadaceae bacterium]KAF0184813.1 MAG: hypothetical protein FD163_1510 [Hyphomonadaceae bacterium]